MRKVVQRTNLSLDLWGTLVVYAEYMVDIKRILRDEIDTWEHVPQVHAAMQSLLCKLEYFERKDKPNANINTLRRVALLIKVAEAADALVGDVILPSASSDLYNAVRELRAFDGQLVTGF